MPDIFPLAILRLKIFLPNHIIWIDEQIPRPRHPVALANRLRVERLLGPNRVTLSPRCPSRLPRRLQLINLPEGVVV